MEKVICPNFACKYNNAYHKYNKKKHVLEAKKEDYWCMREVLKLKDDFFGNIKCQDEDESS